MDQERANLMAILRSHSALDEYTRLQQRFLETQVRAKDLRSRLDNLKRFESGKSSLIIEKERLLQRAHQDHDERSTIRESAISTCLNSGTVWSYLRRPIPEPYRRC